MPDVIEPPEKPFSQQLRDSLPANDSATRATQAAQAAPPEPSKPKPEHVPSSPPPGKSAPTAAPSADADEEILAGKRAPKGDDFKRVKHAATEANKRADELKAKYEAAEKKAADFEKRSGNRDEIIKLQKERDELAGKWQAVAAQFDSGFHAKYDAKVNEAVAKIKDAVPADRLNDLAQVLQMPDGERKRKIMAELTEDMDAPTVTDIMLANREVRDILAARKKELEDSGTILKISAENRQKEQEERKTAYAKSFDDVLAKSQAKDGEAASPLYQLREGDEAWNAGVAERSAVARKGHFDEFDTSEDKAEFSLNAAAYPAALLAIKELQTENASLKETLGKIQSTSPDIRSSGAKGGTVEKSFTQEMMERAM